MWRIHHFLIFEPMKFPNLSAVYAVLDASNAVGTRNEQSQNMP